MKNAHWFAVGATAVGVSFIAQSPYMAFAVYAFLFLVALAHVSSLAWLAGLDCERTVSVNTMQQGEETDIEVKITNNRGWPIPWIFFEDLYPKDFPKSGDNMRLAVLMPGRSVTMNYKLQCPRRGYHRIGPLMMESGDLFGLQRRFRTGKQQDYVTVLPTIAYISTFSIGARRPQGAVRVTNRIYQDPTRIAGVRAYMPGDPLSLIHWKASARTGDLFTKMHEPSQVLGGTLVLNMFGQDYAPRPDEQTDRSEARIELAVTVTASIAYLLQMSGEQVGMLTNGADAAETAMYDVDSHVALSRQESAEAAGDEADSDRVSPLQVPTVRSTIQAQKIAENLARVLPGNALTIERLLLSQCEGLPRDATLLPVVPRVTESVAMTLASMKMSGFSVTVFLIDNAAEHPQADALLAVHNIHCFHIESIQDLYEIKPEKI